MENVTSAATSEIVYVLDKEQRHTHVFGSWLQRENLSADFFLGKTAREILGPEAAPVHEAANRRALAGEDVVYEWSIGAPAVRRWFQTSLSPVRDVAGEIVGVVGVGREITGSREMSAAAPDQTGGFLVICAHCKRIRDEESRWRSVEAYFSERSGVRFSHTICQPCFEAQYREYLDRRQGE